MLEYPVAHPRPLLASTSERARSWIYNVGIAAAVGSIYFLATSLAFGLLFKTDTIAVFWPASGISAGALIALGWRWRWPVATGVMVAVVAIHLIASDTTHPLLVGTVSGLADVVETLVIAGLVERWCGTPFTLDRLRNVVGMVAAAIIGISISAIGGIAASRLKPELLHTEPMLTIWLHWVASNMIGFLTVAPLLIGIAASLRSPPARNEIIEGGAALAVLAVMTAIIISLNEKHWETLVPLAWLFPVLSWIAGRCRPVFAAAGVFIVSITIIWTTTSGIGHFGDLKLSFDERILAAQVGILIVAVVAFVLAALFAERRATETRLTQSNIMLERERANRLAGAEAAVAAIAHEIRQPLAGMSIRAGAGRRFLDRTSPDVIEAKLLFEQIIGDASRTNEVCESFLSLFRDSSQAKGVVDVNQLALEAIALLRDELRDHNVTTATKLASALPRIPGSEGRLREVLLNLIQNAIEAMTTTTDRPRVLTVATKSLDSDSVLISLQDTGPGIDPERLPRIFDSFVTTKAKGTGLGLGICKLMVDRHGGSILAVSEPGGGARFEITLPTK